MANALGNFNPLGSRGGVTPQSFVSAAGLNVTQVANGPGQLVAVALGNVNAAARFVKFYDVANAPTSGLQGLTPVMSLLVPGNAAGAGSNVVGAAGQPFTGAQFYNGIAFMTTVNIAVADASGVGAGDVVINTWSA